MSHTSAFPNIISAEQPQQHRQNQQPALTMDSNGGLQVAQDTRVSNNTASHTAITQTAGIDLTQFPPALVAQILQAIQMGAIPMPPPPPSHIPSAEAVVPPPRVTHAQVPGRTHAPSWTNVNAAAQQPLVNGYTGRGRGEDGPVNKEGYDVEDGEVEDQSKVRGFLHPPPTGPRTNSTTTHSETGRRFYESELRNVTPNSSRVSGSGIVEVQKEDAPKDFILELHKAGYKFADLAAELGDTAPLRRIYHQLGLSIPAKDAAIVKSSLDHVEVRKASLIKRPDPVKPAAAADRTEYLKRLAAARNKAPAKAAALPPPVVQPIKLPSHSLPPAVQPDLPLHMQAGPSSKKSVTKIDETTAAAKRLLLKERLDALKAKQAAKLSGAPSVATTPRPVGTMPRTVTSSSPKSQPDISGARLNEAVTSKAADSQAVTPKVFPAMAVQDQYVVPPETKSLPPVTSRTPFRSLPGLQSARLPGLPGLSGSVKSAISSSTAETIQPSVSTSVSTYIPSTKIVPEYMPKLPVLAASGAIENMLVVAKRSAGPDFETPTGAPRRPFGASRHGSTTEQFIIQTSDDDDDDDDGYDDEDTDKALSLPSAGHPGTGSLSQIEANVQKLKEKIAAIEMAKITKSNGSTPVDGVDGSSAEIRSLAAKSSAADGRSTPHNLFVHEEIGTLEDSRQTSVDDIDQSLVRPERVYLEQGNPSGMALSLPSEPHRHSIAGLEQVISHPIQQSNSGGSSPSSEDFYVDDDRISGPAISSANVRNATHSPTHNSQPDSESTFGVQVAGGKSDELVEANHPAEQLKSSARALREGSATDSSKSLDQSSDDDDDSDDDEQGQEADMMDEDDNHADAVDTLANPATNRDTNVTRDTINLNESSGSESPASESHSDSEETDEDEYEPGDNISNAPAMILSDAKPFPGPHTFTTVNEDLVPELQRQQFKTAKSSDQEPKQYFKPYVSHLTGFKDFRYHPDFLKVVPGGYKSLTYSNKIDPQLAFCPRESLGEICDDPDCKWQHYESAALNDNELLMSLGMTHPPVNNDDEKQKWKDGLGALIRQLRLSKLGSDVNVIAAHICDYRRKFVGDDSKIIHLGS